MRALMHHLHIDNFRRAFRELDGSKACGVDGVTKQKYEVDLESNLRALHHTIRCGGWRPRPSREVLIPKPQGGTRPLAVGCLEDKIVQTLTARILEAVYEPLFHRHSYGFRRGKSAHQALGRLYSVIEARQQKCVVVEMDIEKFFNSVDHEWLLQKLKLKIDDVHFLRHIRRLLRGSILHEDGSLAERSRSRKPLKQLWVDAAARLSGHFNYFGVRFNEAKLSYFRFVCIGALFKWLNRRSQKRSFNWEKFGRKLHFNPLPLAPHGEELIDITSEHRAVRKHQPKSRVRENRTHGSERSLSRSRRLRFT